MAATGEIHVFKDALIILGTAAVVAPVMPRLKVSPVLGYLAMGALLGPYGLVVYDAADPAAKPIVADGVAILTIAVASMMVSRIPTFSLKAVRIPAKMGMTIMAGISLLLAALVNIPWPTLTVVGICYIASIPFSMAYYRILKKNHQEGEDDVGLQI